MKSNVFTKITSVACATALMATMGVSAFAADPVETEGTEIYVSKQLNIAQGLAAPENFTFNFTEKTTNAPKIAPLTVTMNGEEDTDADGYIIKTTSYDLSDADWNAAGVYKYEVTENDAETAGMTYDKNTYELMVWVKNADDGGFTVERIAVEDKATNEKVDAGDPGEPEEYNEGTTVENTDAAASGVLFENTYTKTAYTDEVPDGPEDITDDPTTEGVDESYASFVGTKTVTGEYGDLEHAFPFALDIDFAGAIGATDAMKNAVKVYVYDASEKVWTDVTGNYASIALAHNDKVAVYNAPIGTVCTLTENLEADAAFADYAASLAVTEWGQNVEAEAVAYNAERKGINTKAEVLVADGVNSAAFTNKNTNEDVTPTGILINNAPYIILAVVAAGGMTAYVVRRRQENE